MAKTKAPLVDTRVIYCGDNLEQLKKFPDTCVDLIYIDPPFNSNRNYEVFWGETKEKRAFEDRHASTQAYIAFMRPRCEQLARVLKKTGSFYYHCDWHASHYIKVMLDEIFGENNFVNEIIWHYRRWSAAAGFFQRMHDTLFWYAKSGGYTFNKPMQSYSHPEMIEDTVRGMVDGKLVRLKNEKGVFIKRKKPKQRGADARCMGGHKLHCSHK